MQGPVTAIGIKFKVFGYRVRVWRYGFEYEKNGHGTTRFFPWAKVRRPKQ